MLRKVLLGATLATSVFAFPAQAVSPNGYASILTLPVIAQTASYLSFIFIHNPHSVTITVKPDFVGADGSATPGALSCPAVNILAGRTNQYSLSTLCPGVNAGSNFGRLKLFEQNADNRPFAAYSRVETPSGNGFSIEGFPIGNFANAEFIDDGYSYVLGLRRQAAAPGYQSNCFIGSLNEAVTVDLALFSSTGASIGSTQNFVLGANQMIRILDVFNAVGAAAGDYSNVRARFSEQAGAEPSFVAFCTVQNNTSFDADFRIAKAYDIGDETKRFTTVITFQSGTTQDFVGNNLPALTGANAHVWGAFFQHPDWVRCDSSGIAGTGTFEVALFDPTGNLRAGGNNQASFAETYLGEKSTRNNGVNGLWVIRVENGQGGVSLTGYTLTCTSGNGHSRPVYLGTGTDQF